MHVSRRSTLNHLAWLGVAGLLLAQLFSGGLAQTTSSAPLDTLRTLAQGLFRELEVRSVPCPAYTHDGGNEPVCGLTERSPKAFTEAFSEAAEGRLEPEGAWSQDHTVWLRTYRAGSVRYAAIYSGISAGFNVQLVRLK